MLGLAGHCLQAAKGGMALDNEEAGLDVGCIVVLPTNERNRSINVLSISAPLSRRQASRVTLLKIVQDQLAERMGYFH